MPSLKFPLAVSLLAALAYVCCTWLFARDLPDYIATHFDVTGRPNDVMSRSHAIAFELALGLGTQVFVSLMSWVPRYFSPARMNVPNKAYWHKPEHFPLACALIFRHSLWLGSLIAVWLVLLNYQVRLANLEMPPHLNPQAFLVAMGTFLIMLVIWLVSLFRLFRIPRS